MIGFEARARHTRSLVSLLRGPVCLCAAIMPVIDRKQTRDREASVDNELQPRSAGGRQHVSRGVQTCATSARSRRDISIREFAGRFAWRFPTRPPSLCALAQHRGSSCLICASVRATRRPSRRPGCRAAHRARLAVSALRASIPVATPPAHPGMGLMGTRNGDSPFVVPIEASDGQAARIQRAARPRPVDCAAFSSRSFRVTYFTRSRSRRVRLWISAIDKPGFRAALRR